MDNLTGKFRSIERLLRSNIPDDVTPEGEPVWNSPYDDANIGGNVSNIYNNVEMISYSLNQANISLEAIASIKDDTASVPDIAPRVETTNNVLLQILEAQAVARDDIAALLATTNATLAVLVKAVRGLSVTQEIAMSCCTTANPSAELVAPPVDVEDEDITSAKPKTYRASRWVDLGTRTHNQVTYRGWAPVFSGRPGYVSPTVVGDDAPYQSMVAPVGTNVSMTVSWDWMTSGSIRPRYYWQWGFAGAPSTPTTYGFFDTLDIRKDSMEIGLQTPTQKIYAGMVFWTIDSEVSRPPLNIWAVYTGILP